MAKNILSTAGESNRLVSETISHVVVDEHGKTIGYMLKGEMGRIRHAAAMNTRTQWELTLRRTAGRNRTKRTPDGILET